MFLFNRRDCCSERLNDVQVTVGYSSHMRNPLCGTFQQATGRRVLEIKCSKPLQGRYVTVSIPRPMLSLCEVQVMGVPVRAGFGE